MVIPALAQLDIDGFLRDYWQQKPLVLKGDGSFSNPLSAEELAGLALDDMVESRIVETADNNWQLQNGPFEIADFARKSIWTLLVQRVDHFSEAVATLKRAVAFLPNWRFDDVMVSYAVDGAGVGPHFDHYDVFLLQGQGKRRWRLGQWCNEQSALKADTELRILEHFDESASYELEPGDILYVPPLLAHWGESIGDSMTYSLGFRAPRINNLLSRWVDATLEQLEADSFYTDPTLTLHARAGEIKPETVSQAKRQILERLEEYTDPRWFGELVTESGMETPAQLPQPQFDRRLLLLEDARLAWMELPDKLLVFANGATIESTNVCQGSIETLCAHSCLTEQQVKSLSALPGGQALLRELAEAGCIDVE